MTLRKRLSKLEAQHKVLQTGPRVIITEVYWRDDQGKLQSIAKMVKVLTPVGWQIVNRGDNESEPAFRLRVEAMNSSAFT